MTRSRARADTRVHQYRATHVPSGRCLARRVRPAVGFRQRLVGLLGRRSLTPQEGLWLAPCGSVHTWGLRFSLDVLFLDGEHRILRVVDSLEPWRIALAPPGTRSVLELAAGAAHGVRPGDALRLE